MIKVVVAASEMAPFVKTGGLADVSGALPKYINRDKFEVIAVIPYYSSIKSDSSEIEYIGTFSVPDSGASVKCGLFKTTVQGSSVPLYLLRYGPYFDRGGIYGEEGADYDDNDRRFSFFCRGLLEMCRAIGFVPDLIHCNDWQTGLIPVFLKTLYSGDLLFSSTSTLFTIHNLAFHGSFDPERIISITGLPWSVYSMYGAEFYGGFSFLKSGLYFSDYISTVSRRYSEEIQSEEYGMGLQGLLRSRRGTLTGIVNGVDYHVWDPETDQMISANYSCDDIDKKRVNTETLCLYCGIEYKKSAPVIGMITRLTEQKGIDLVAGIIDRLMMKDVRFVLLGTGDEYYHSLFSALKEKYSGRFHVTLGFDEKFSHRIYAGSDIFLMPSRFEPCGLGQIISLRYGTIPVARETGGLADTITDYGPADKPDACGTGFLFKEYSSDAFYECVERSLEVYRDNGKWRGVMSNAMKADFSWRSSAIEYEKIYRKLCVTSEGIS
ncbi:MAG TPA: glycogen synthase GlgA [Spirochaetota bacterium]|nr:glycogen synthase GlgA [Spirochaetota bacterium]